MLRLPVELIHQVTDHVDSNDLVNLQSTCKELRAILIAKLWSHVDLKCSPAKSKRLSIQKYTGQHSTHCKDTSFYHKHSCKRGGYVASDIDTNMRQFAKAVLRGDFSLAYEWVHVLTLSAPAASTTRRPSELVVEHERDIDAMDSDAVISWLLTQIPQKFVNLRLLELMVDYGSTGHSVFSNLINHYSHVETNVSLHLNSLQAAAPLNLATANIKIFRVQCQALEDVQRLCGGGHLPNTVQRFDLECYQEMDAMDLKRLFENCDRLTSVSLKWGNIKNPRSVEWLPQSVTSLQMLHYKDCTRVQLPMTAPNVTQFKTFTRMGDVFQAVHMPNLERLKVKGPLDDDRPLLQAVTKAMSTTSREVKQLKVQQLRVDFVSSLLKMTRPGIRSLAVQPGSASLTIPFSEYCRLATQLQDSLDCLVITLTSLQQSEVVRFFRKVLTFCPSISKVYFEHVFMEPPNKSQAWVEKVDTNAICDGYSKIKVDSRWCYKINVDQFRQQFLDDKSQDRIKACAVREGAHVEVFDDDDNVC